MAIVTTARQALRGSRSVAALLSFVWPGLGQLYAGKRRLAALFAVPAIGVALLVLYQARQGLTVFAARFLDPAFALWALVLILGFGVWRAISVIHAFVAVPEGGPAGRRTQRAVLGVLLALIVAVHGVGGAVAYMDYTAFSNVFTPVDLSDDPVDQLATPPPDVFDNSTQPPPSAEPTQWPVTGRVTILLTGVDAFSGRSERLYDSIMVVSLDTTANTLAMVSVPRDSAAFPLYFGGTVGTKTRINSLVSYVQHGWIKSPDDPMTTFVKEIGFLVGIPIDYYAVIDMEGFLKMIDLVGGIDIDNPSDINDPVYDWLDGSPHGFSLSAGPHHLDSRQTLAYVRSRHGINNSDWKRSSRQQEVLVALERKMASPGMLPELPSMLQTLGSSIKTTFPAGQVADMVAQGEQIPKANIKQVVLGPPYSNLRPGGSSGPATSCLRLDKIAELSVALFGPDSRYYGKKQANTCPA
jgi:LCP family protein required for cell wall assembly